MLRRLQASANVDIRVVSKADTDGGPSSAIRILQSESHQTDWLTIPPNVLRRADK
jgi:hypothetical protein